MMPSTGVRRQQSARRNRRGQSSILGLTLVFGLMLAGALLVVTLGAGAIGDSQEKLSVQRAEKAMTQFDSQAALVALGNTDVQEVSFGNSQASHFEVTNDTGWMRVSYENRTSRSRRTLLNESLGSITYETDGTRLAYQGGGVWKDSGGSSVMVSPPEFHHRGGTLTLPVVTVDGEPSLGSRASVRHEETVREFPNPAAGKLNPLDDHQVQVTVQSRYYRAWGHYFEERTDGEVEYDHDRKLAVLTLVSPLGRKKVDEAVRASGSNGVRMTGGGDDPCSGGVGGARRYTDSYNSSEGDYCSTRGDDGNFTYAGSVYLGGNADMRGSVRSGNWINVSGSAEITGDAYYTSVCDGCAGQVLGTISQLTSDIDPENPIGFTIERYTEDLNESNDNADADRIDATTDRLDYQSGQAELQNGRYYLEKIQPSGSQDIVLNTTDGPILLAVEEYVDLGNNGLTNEIEIEGNNVVNVYVNGSRRVPGRTDHFYMSQNDKVVVDDRNSTQLRVYGKRDFELTLKSSGSNRAEFVGVVFAPVGQYGSGSVTVDQGNLWGGVITGEIEISNGASFSYDEALDERQVISPGAKVVKVTYLHVSTNRIYVSS